VKSNILSSFDLFVMVCFEGVV